MFVQIIKSPVRDAAGMRRHFFAGVERLHPTAVGWLGATSGVTTEGVWINVICFESTDAAARNSARPEQGEWWAEGERYRDGDARAWLLAIVRNCCLTWHRRHKVDANIVPLTETAPISDGLETDALAIQRSERDALQRAVEALPTEFREVIVLREIEDLSYREISNVVGVPVGTVMSRLARARKRLASALGMQAKEAG